MRKFLIISLLFLSVFLLDAPRLYSQEKDSVNYGDYRLSTGLVMGRYFCGEPFYMNNTSFEYSKWITPKFGVRLGVGGGLVSSHMFKEYEDKAPYSRNYVKTSTYIGLDYLVNPKMLISLNAFSDFLSPHQFLSSYRGASYYTHGVNANFTYKFSNESLLSVSLTIVESNNPMMFCYPYSMYHNPYMSYGIGSMGFGTGFSAMPFTSF